MVAVAGGGGIFVCVACLLVKVCGIIKVCGGTRCVCALGLVSIFLFAIFRSVCGTSAKWIARYIFITLNYVLTDTVIAPSFIKWVLIGYWANAFNSYGAFFEIITDVATRVKYEKMLWSRWLRCSQRLGCIRGWCCNLHYHVCVCVQSCLYVVALIIPSSLVHLMLLSMVLL